MADVPASSSSASPSRRLALIGVLSLFAVVALSMASFRPSSTANVAAGVKREQQVQEQQPVDSQEATLFVTTTTTEPLETAATSVAPTSMDTEDVAAPSSQETEPPQQSVAIKNISSSSNNNAIAECNNKLGLGYYWNYTESACLELDGFASPLLSFEVSSDELSCKNSSMTAHIEVTSFQGDGSSSSSSFEEQWKQSNAAAYPDPKWREFVFSSSWLFRQWRRFGPVVSETTSSKKGSGAGVEFFSTHDPELENLLRIDNFCISAFQGLSGFMSNSSGSNGSRIAEYRGKDDTWQKQHHNEPEFKAFFSNVRKLKAPPTSFDARPVTFVPAMPRSRMNIGHTSNKLLSLVGILDRKLFSDASSSSSSSAVKPLVVFVLQEADEQSEQSESNLLARYLNLGRGAGAEILRQHTNAWGMFFAALNVPWAVTLATPIPLQDTSLRLKRVQRLTKLFELTSHAVPRSLSDPEAIYNSVQSQTGDVCFRRAVAYQNCFACELNGDPAVVETESYSFGNYVAMTEPRRRLIDGYLRRIELCLPPASQPSPAQQQQNNRRHLLPRIFFHVRSFHRGIKNFGAMIDIIHRNVVRAGFASEIIYREPWTHRDPSKFGSRARYLMDLRDSDIFVGTHSGAFAEVVHMHRRPKPAVVVEFAAPWSACPDNPRCWFAPFTNYIGADHWIYHVPRIETRRHTSFRLMPSVVVRALQEAACRWMKTHGMLEPVSSSSSSSSVSPAATVSSWCLRSASYLERNSSSPPVLIKFKKKALVRVPGSKSEEHNARRNIVARQPPPPAPAPAPVVTAHQPTPADDAADSPAGGGDETAVPSAAVGEQTTPKKKKPKTAMMATSSRLSGGAIAALFLSLIVVGGCVVAAVNSFGGGD